MEDKPTITELVDDIEIQNINLEKVNDGIAQSRMIVNNLDNDIKTKRKDLEGDLKLLQGSKKNFKDYMKLSKHLMKQIAKLEKQLKKSTKEHEKNTQGKKRKKKSKDIISLEDSDIDFDLIDDDNHKKKKIKKTQESTCCSICFEDNYLIPATLACKHQFHSGCIDKWIDSCEKQSKRSHCPICRKEISVRYNGNIYYT